LGFADFSIHGVASRDVTLLGYLWVRTERNLFVVGDDSVKNGSEVGALS